MFICTTTNNMSLAEGLTEKFTLYTKCNEKLYSKTFREFFCAE